MSTGTMLYDPVTGARRECSNCLHADKSTSDYPCRCCGVTLGNGPHDKWEPTARATQTPAEAAAPGDETIRFDEIDAMWERCRIEPWSHRLFARMVTRAVLGIAEAAAPAVVQAVSDERAWELWLSTIQPGFNYSQPRQFIEAYARALLAEAAQQAPEAKP